MHVIQSLSNLKSNNLLGLSLVPSSKDIGARKRDIPICDSDENNPIRHRGGLTYEI